MKAGIMENGKSRPDHSLVFPTYNAIRCLDRTWNEVHRFLRQTTQSWEILFVCDGCTDGTLERLEKLSRQETDRIRIVSHAPNRGKGYTVRQGLQAALGRWRIFTDVDLAYGFEDVERVASALRGGADLAIASRHHPDSRLILPPRLQGYMFRRHLQSLAFSSLVRLFLPVTQWDTQAGLKGMTEVFARTVLPRLQCNGFGFDCELLVACAEQEWSVVEVPVCLRCDDAVSTTGARTMLRMIWELWRIRRAWRRRKRVKEKWVPERDFGRTPERNAPTAA